MRCILAVDQSTSATKALLFSYDGAVVDRESRDHVQHYPQPGWVEHDAEEIWQNVLATTRALIARHPGVELTGLSLTNQRETFVIFDRRTGAPLERAIVWQCRRSESLCTEARAAGHGPDTEERTGLRIDPYFSGSKLLWLFRNRPRLRELAARGEAVVGTIDAYLIHRLTRGAVFACDSTNASRTLCYDIRKLAWSPELCARWEVPLQALPEVRDSFARFGETTLEGTLSQPISICGVMGDSQAALFAHGCFTPGSAKVTLGTGSSILMNLGSECRRSREGVITALAWTRDGQPTYAFEGIIISAASTLTWLRDQLGIVDDLAQVEALARELPDNGGVHFVPAFSGLGLPYWQPEARAAIVGLSSHSDRRHLIRAALESIAFQLDDALTALRAEAGLPLAAIHADGGPTRNRFLMQFIADLAGTELRLAPVAECSAWGAASAGLIGLGLCTSPESAVSQTASDGVFRPAMKPEQSDFLRRRWHQAVRQAILPPVS